MGLFIGLSRIFGKRNKLDEEYSIEKINESHSSLYQEIKPYLDSFANKDKDEKSRLWENILSMIYHVHSRLEYWENRRTQFMQVAAILLAASVAGLITILPELLNEIFNIKAFNGLQPFIYAPFALVLLYVILGSAYLIYTWNNQNNPNYPFTKAYRIWRWQYRGAEKESTETKLLFNNMDEYEKQIKKFGTNLKYYKEKTIISSEKDLFDQDLSQLFLLITNEKYKIKYLSNLRDILFGTILGSLFLYLFLFLLAFVYWLASLNCIS